MNENVIARRKIKAIDPRGKTHDLEIVIGQPFEVSQDEWACPVSMEGIYKHRGPIFGVDSMQALLLAIKFLKDLLIDFSEKGGKLFWPESSDPITIDELFHL